MERERQEKQKALELATETATQIEQTQAELEAADSGIDGARLADSVWNLDRAHGVSSLVSAMQPRGVGRGKHDSV